MLRQIAIIAGREVRTYVATLSFWIALVAPPVLALGLNALAPASPTTPARMTPYRVTGPAALDPGVDAALQEAAGLEGLALRRTGDLGRAPITLSEDAQGLVLAFPAGFPLSAEGRVLVARTVERDIGSRGDGGVSVRILGAAGAGQSGSIRDESVQGLIRALTVWILLTGSLGMLLQAAVRERSNRALESLLAAASPHAILFGKLVGVGAVSLVMLSGWLLGGSLLGQLSDLQGMAAIAAGAFRTPQDLVATVAAYLSAFLLYGLATIGVGAAARDSASAQNLVRPVFGALIVVLLVVMRAGVSGGGRSGLLFVPPAAPFLWLSMSPDSVDRMTWGLSFGVFCVVAYVVMTVSAAQIRIRSA